MHKRFELKALPEFGRVCTHHLMPHAERAAGKQVHSITHTSIDSLYSAKRPRMHGIS